MRILCLLGVVCLMIGCAQEDKAYVKLVPKGNSGTLDEISKPSPLSDGEQTLLIFDEITKLHRSLRHVADRPATKEVSREGCVTYAATPQFDRFLVATFSCQRTTKADGAKLPSMRYEIDGKEIYESNEGKTRATIEGRFTVTITALVNPPRQIAQFDYRRQVNVALPAGSLDAPDAAFPYYGTTTSTPIVGKDKIRRDKWELEFEGEFHRGEEHSFWMKNVRAELQYWIPQTTASKPSHVYAVTSEQPVTFSSGCPRAHGAFSWDHVSNGGKSQTSGRWVSDEKGVTDVDSGALTSWPTQCGDE